MLHWFWSFHKYFIEFSTFKLFSLAFNRILSCLRSRKYLQFYYGINFQLLISMHNKYKFQSQSYSCNSKYWNYDALIAVLLLLFEFLSLCFWMNKKNPYNEFNNRSFAILEEKIPELISFRILILSKKFYFNATVFSWFDLFNHFKNKLNCLVDE